MNTGTSQALVVRPKDLALAVQSNGLAVEQDMLYAAVAELGKFPALVRKVRGVPLAKLVGTVGTEKWKEPERHEPERTVEDANEHCFGLFRLDYGKNPRVFLNLGATRQLSEWVPGDVTCVREAHEGPEAVACTLVHESGHYLYAVKLLNGQHRLHAVIKSGQTIDTVVQWGIPRDSQDTIDDGAKWSAKDLLHIKGEQNTHLLQATLAWLNREAHGALGTTIKMTNTVAMELLEAHPNIRQSCHFVAGLSGRCPLIPSGAAYLHYRFSEVDSEKADEFFRRLASGLGLTETSPIYRLRERLLKNQTTKEKLRSADQLAFTIIAWNALVEGRPLGLLVWRKSGPTAQGYPTIRGLDVPVLPRKMKVGAQAVKGAGEYGQGQS